MDKTYSIGETSKMTGTNAKTIRYYDEIGLIKPAGHTEGGHRLYTTEDMWRLELIATLRYLDFGIDEIRQIISEGISVEKALDWQIESLETQANTITNMISILRQAKERKGDSLRYIHDLVNTRTIDTEKRQQFIAEKVEESKLFEDIPADWRGSLLYFFNKYIIQQPKVSAKQTAAWQELQELINDPQFIADLKNVEPLLFPIFHQPRYNAATWVRKLEDIHKRLDKALKQQYSAGSSMVQTIVDDMAMLYANSEQLNPKEDFCRYFAEYFQTIQTKHLERCNTLCSIISPQYHQLSKGSLLLYQGVQWKLQHRQEQTFK
ncbi:MerR family transcriptional regulator [Paenibacillus donghaensis]|uniref:MerR family transcriptional regulator n=1 Tax=Paenibacillus donghaensis TaxID=414771 RepID=UPI001D162E85|nr:MerR family transcriptional regulator [Paenibacillus donghaensis]